MLWAKAHPIDALHHPSFTIIIVLYYYMTKITMMSLSCGYQWSYMISKHATMPYYCCKNSDQYVHSCSHCKINGHVISLLRWLMGMTTRCYCVHLSLQEMVTVYTHRASEVISFATSILLFFPLLSCLRREKNHVHTKSGCVAPYITLSNPKSRSKALFA